MKLPFFAALIVFVVAVASTQLALRLANREADQQIERLANVYLDGLKASTQPFIEAENWPAVDAGFRRAFTVQKGVAEVGLYLVDSHGSALVSTATGASPTIPTSISSGAQSFRLDSSAGLAWVRRSTTSDEKHALVAALDVSDTISARGRLFWSVALLDLIIAALCGLLTYLVLRRLGRPIDGLLALLQDGARRPEPVPPTLAARASKELRPVLAAYNEMIDGLRDRDRLRAEIAERTQAAALGRLAATLAHEVRNPLGGLATAVTTLRKFGGDPQVRAESLEFLARGIDSLDALVTRTLNVYRPEDERRFAREDFEDIRLLVEPAARKQEVELAFEIEVPGPVNIAASGVRQVLLNLLLNAVAVSPRSGRVCLEARIVEQQLTCLVSDEGPGMEQSHIRRLLGEDAQDIRSRRIGIDAIVSILGDLNARVSVQGNAGGGTAVRVEIPLEAQP
ncbi:MAG: HAMP domain-containing histidine kinase [Methylobacterium sp.]|nr:HAMP domain-containing histidine kinase [Methylobacterium sp.]MCA3657250.1 HAMP domain-containing histidine kinase [Methylobacterium sp.]MCA3661693.1 HAMP domain-containing histidine kinase [Methylobacterium sp.]MCA3664440.1 HAMP domain-containing histidine kinase [Methylobacterium sp.]MCA3666889.1 HAMP domain-containing histidine kinase [Methylobacterium sp.]